MAILSDSNKTEIRQVLAKSGISVNYAKAQANLAMQAVEDWFELAAVKTAISNAINTATAPFVFTPEQKKQIIKHWLYNRFGRE